MERQSRLQEHIIRPLNGQGGFLVRQAELSSETVPASPLGQRTKGGRIAYKNIFM